MDSGLSAAAATLVKLLLRCFCDAAGTALLLPPTPSDFLVLLFLLNAPSRLFLLLGKSVKTLPTRDVFRLLALLIWGMWRRRSPSKVLS